MDSPLPDGTRLIADPSLRTQDDGHVLLGGSPFRFMRLTAAGARLVQRWLRGEPPTAGSGQTKLARRLIRAGMAHPDPPPIASPASITVVIPVKDDQAGLDLTLAGLDTVPVVVVDDGSRVPLVLRDRPPASGTTLLRRENAGGPGIARQTGLTVVETSLVFFVDAGVVVTAEQIERLSRWFADPDVVAVGPRVASADGPGLIDRFELANSPLDLGLTPSPVGHGRTVSYLPTACLAVRREAVDEAGGFDPALRFGEDVDLVWRLIERGDVRYDPSVVTTHPARGTLEALATQRYGYGLAAAPLAERHGSELAPVRTSGWSLGCWGLVLGGHPILGVALAAYTGVELSRKLAGVIPDHQVEAALLTARGHWFAGQALADAAARIWWPVSFLLSLPRSPLARSARLLLALAWLQKARRTEGALDERLRHLALGILDDVAYGTGVWVGAWRHRSARCLLPLVVNWPPKDEESSTGR